MAIIGVLQTAVFAGTINTSQTFPNSPSMSMQHNFSASNIWSYPFPQLIDINDDDAEIDVWVSSFTDASGVHAGKFFGIFAKGCTNVSFGMFTRDCLARVVFNTEFFG